MVKSAWLGVQGLAVAIGLGAALQGSATSHEWPPERKLRAREDVRGLWYHGFDNYMTNAFPMDELRPISCQGKGPDWDDPTNYGANDVNGNFSITLVDVLDTFVTLNDPSGFDEAVRKVIDHVSFDVNTKPQVFETTIRALGGLLSAHIFAADEDLGQQFSSPRSNHSSFKLDWYQGELLDMALDLGKRLLPAFQTPTGMPYARINLRTGVPPGETTQTCAAGAGSLVLEFTTLSRLTGDPRFEEAAKKSFMAVWDRRTSLNLIGNGIDVITGSWYYPIGGGIGAGIDSFYEYALKMHVLTGEQVYLDIWNEAYAALMTYSKGADGHWYRSISAYNGEVAVTHIDSLGAFWPGLQVLAGDIENAIKAHLTYWNLWKRFGGMPETFNIVTKEGITIGYPLRPEFIESTYFLYRATKDPFYLSVGERALEDITTRTRVTCGLTTISNLLTGQQEDRMESFVLSETLKYLFLLFDEENPIHKLDSNFIFTTEGHVLSLSGDQLKSTLQQAVLPAPRAITAKQPENPFTCPTYHPTRLNSWVNQTSGGLFGSIEDRADVDYARQLAGLEFLDHEISVKNRPDGICEVPPSDAYFSSFILTPHGVDHSDEDVVPSKDKISTIKDGLMVYDITGIRLKTVTRLDGKGYDIVGLGQHDVEKNQKVYFADPKLLKESEVVIPPTPRSHEQDVPLRFFLDQGGTSTTASSGITRPADVFTTGSAAKYGDHPAKAPDAGQSGRRPKLRFGKGYSALPLVRPPSTNMYGCFPYDPLPHSPYADNDIDSEFTFNPRYLDTVLLIERGECTFVEKLNMAEQAGARGVVVISSELVVPSLGEGDGTDRDLVEMYLPYIGMVVIAGNQTIQELDTLMDMAETGAWGVRVMVQVAEPPASPVQTESLPKPATSPSKTKAQWDALREAGVGRPLYINGKKLHNAVLLF